jgi:hypothetical protein
VLHKRQKLKEQSDLGEFGAMAIHHELRVRGHAALPSVRMITTPLPISRPHRLVRCEVDLGAGSVAFYALRRRDPNQQPLLRTAPFVLPHSAVA